MLTLEIRYNHLKDKQNILNDYIIGIVVCDNRREHGSCEITLNDIDKRFSTGTWQAYKGDTIEVVLGGSNLGSYEIKRIVRRRSPSCVVWECTGAVRSSSKGKSQSKGAKASVKSQKMNDRVCGNLYKGQSAVPEGTRLSGVLRAMSDYTGVKFESSLTKLRDGYWPQDSKTKSKDPDMSRADLGSMYSFWDFLERICNRFGCTYHATSEKITLIERKVTKGTEVKKSVELQVDDINDVQDSDEICPKKLKVSAYDPSKKAAHTVEVNDGTDGSQETEYGFMSQSVLESISEDGLLSGKTGTLIINPTAGIVAGSIVKLYNNEYDVQSMTYSQMSSNETMSLEIKSR